MSRACAKSSAATSLSPSFGSAEHQATGMPSGVVIRYSFSPKTAGMRHAVAVVGDSGQLRAFDGLPGGGARDGCAVDQPQVVVPGRALRGQVQHGLVDQRGGGLDPFVVAGLFGQIREQVPKPAVTHSQPMVFASCAEQHLRHGQAHELGVGEPFRPPGPWPRRLDDMVVDDHIQFGEEGIEVRHKRPSMPSSHTSHKQTRRACNHQAERRADQRAVGNHSSRRVTHCCFEHADQNFGSP